MGGDLSQVLVDGEEAGLRVGFVKLVHCDFVLIRSKMEALVEGQMMVMVVLRWRMAVWSSSEGVVERWVHL